MSNIKSAVQCLKREKQDGVFDIISDHFIEAPEYLYKHLCVLFTSCMHHGYLPCNMLMSTMIPIPKDALGNIQSSDNYRGIALSTMCNKLFEYVILVKHKDALAVSDLQFAYKEGVSTTQCTWLAREVISHFTRNGSNVYCTLLDCSKAFDKMRHDKLFHKLTNMEIPAIVVRVLMYMYENSKTCVRWDSSISDYFCVSNGIKQGSVLSPILFNIYVDDLIDELKYKSLGCHIGNQYCGIVVYADDIMLLSPSLTGLQDMLETCNQFSVGYGLAFNARKTMCIEFHVNNRCNLVQHNIKLGSETLQWFSKVKHLGHQFNCCNSFEADIKFRQGKFIACVNNIMT